MTGRPVAPLLMGLVLAVLVVGCYGSTEPASEVGEDRARLNARGTADQGPAYSFFEYTELNQAGQVTGPTLITARRGWPAGVSGPFSELVSGLRDATPYTFRACGGDQGEEPVCAQSRFFQTRGPAGKDSVKGRFGFAPGPRGGVDAVSGPSGENPTGSLELAQGRGTTTTTFVGFVTCLAVSGNRATVGAVGQERTGDGGPQPATRLFSVVDRNSGGEAQLDLVATTASAGGTPPDCAAGPVATGEVGGSLLRVTDN